jgi:toxin ParE1/3/4
MGKYVLSPQARKSLKNIKYFSFKEFGEVQTKLYLEQLRQGMQSAADSPLNGLARDDIKTGYYSKPLNSHIIFYRITSVHLEVIDVLHQRMDYIRHL